MADWHPPERPQSHRASSGTRRTLARLAAPLTAVVVVVVVIVLLIWINGRSDGSGSGSGSNVAVAPASHQPAPSPDGSPTSSHLASPTPRPTHSHHSPSPHPTHHHATPHSSPSPPPSDTAMAPVSVLNNSRIHGLAHHVAAEVESRGWTLAQVGNLRGRVAETTVYYPPTGLAAAEHLAHDFGQIQRLEPQSEAGLHSADLILVVTRFWSG
jgi:hypothetical protein